MHIILYKINMSKVNSEEKFDFFLFDNNNKLFNKTEIKCNKDYDDDKNYSKDDSSANTSLISGEDHEDNSITRYILHLSSEENKLSKKPDYTNEDNINDIFQNEILKEENNNKETDFDSPNFINKLNLDCEPFYPKKKKGDSYTQNNNFCNKKRYNNSNKNKKNKKKSFVEREGDWPCYRCKNINFSFRDKCNKCQLLKEESEKQYIEAGQKLLKLFNNNNLYKTIR